VASRWIVRALVFYGLTVGLAASGAAQSLAVDRQRGLQMLDQIREDLVEHYYDPGFHGLDLEARFKAAEEKIESAGSLGQLMGIIAQAVLFFVIIGALIFQRRGDLDRARELGASSWRSIREVRPIPRELRQLPEIRFGLIAISAVTVLLAVFVPLTLSRSQVNLLGVGLIFAIVMCSLVLLTGWAGQITGLTAGFFVMCAPSYSSSM